MSISSIFGTSLPLWQADEEITAENINLRERRYGGFFQQDFIGTLTLSPTFSTPPTGDLWGTPIYGFQQYNSVAGAGLINDSLATNHTTPAFIQAIATGLYGDVTRPYGFRSYGNSPSGMLLSDSISSGETSPTAIVGNASSQYGPSEFWGFLGYGNENSLFQETIVTSDSSPINTPAAISSNVYGTGKKYGFCAYLP